MERKNVITMKGQPLTRIGKEALPGEKAPNFQVLSTDLTEKALADFNGKIKLIASVPSLDTPVCDLQIKRFNVIDKQDTIRYVEYVKEQSSQPDYSSALAALKAALQAV